MFLKVWGLNAPGFENFCIPGGNYSSHGEVSFGFVRFKPTQNEKTEKNENRKPFTKKCTPLLRSYDTEFNRTQPPLRTSC